MTTATIFDALNRIACLTLAVVFDTFHLNVIPLPSKKHTPEHLAFLRDRLKNRAIIDNEPW